MHKADDYNLAQPSRSGRAGFESFKSEIDGRFYFHFNDAKGEALLFSQAYRREVDRDKGIASVMRNGVIDKHFQQLNTEGAYFFLLFSANKQQIARSRFFTAEIDLEKQLLFFKQNLSLRAEENTETSAENPEAGVPKEVSAINATTATLTTENLALKNKIKDLEGQLQKAPPQYDTSEDTLREVFRIEIYKNTSPERLHGQIIHPFSKETRTFNGLDLKTIGSFMMDKIKMDIAAAAQPISSPVKPPMSAPTMSPVLVVNLNNSADVLRQNQPFAFILSPLAYNRYGIKLGQPTWVELNVFNLDTREKYKLLEKRIAFTAVGASKVGDIAIHIEPLVLNAGSYRLSLVASVLSSNDTEIKSAETQWQGGIIVQVH